MEHSPSCKPDNRQVSRLISSLLWIQKVHYRVHKSQLLGPILNQMYPVQTLIKTKKLTKVGVLGKLKTLSLSR